MLFLLILITGGAFLYNVYVLAALFSICFLWYILEERIELFNEAFFKLYLFLLIFLILSLYHISLNGHYSSSLPIRFFNFLFAICMLLCLYHEKKTFSEVFVEDYSVLGKVFIIHALACSILSFLVPQFYTPIPSNENVLRFLYIFFSCRASEVNIFIAAIPRCMGMFWEPGVLQFFVNIYLFILLFCQKDKRQWLWISLAVLVVLLTQSITGILLMIGLCFYYSLRQKKIISWVILIISVPVIVSVGITLVSQKIFSEDSVNAGSFWTRQADALSSISIALDHPILGIGFDYDDYTYYRSRLRSDSILFDTDFQWDHGNTNSILTFFYALGIPLALYIMIRLYRQRFIQKERFVFWCVLFISFLSEPILQLAFPIMFAFSAMIHDPEHILDKAKTEIPVDNTEKANEA